RGPGIARRSRAPVARRRASGGRRPMAVIGRQPLRVTIAGRTEEIDPQGLADRDPAVGDLAVGDLARGDPAAGDLAGVERPAAVQLDVTGTGAGILRTPRRPRRMLWAAAPPAGFDQAAGGSRPPDYELVVAGWRFEARVGP